MSTSFTIDDPREQAPDAMPEPANPLKRGYKRLIGNKLLLGLVIVCMSAIFVGGVWPTDSPKGKAVEEPAAEPASKTAQAGQPAQGEQAGQTQPAAKFTPQLAIDFVTWWTTQAMDYSQASAKAHHAVAFRWMTPDCQQQFQTCFWTPAMEAEISAGRVTAAFQPASVLPMAINPDGTVVVTMSGLLVMQGAGSPPITTQLVVDLLVRQETQGLRICGLYNHQAQPPAATSYAQPQYSAPPSGMDFMQQRPSRGSDL